MCFLFNFTIDFFSLLPESVGLWRSRKCRKSMSEVGGRIVGVSVSEVEKKCRAQLCIQDVCEKMVI